MHQWNWILSLNREGIGTFVLRLISEPNSSTTQAIKQYWKVVWCSVFLSASGLNVCWFVQGKCTRHFVWSELDLERGFGGGSSCPWSSLLTSIVSEKSLGVCMWCATECHIDVAGKVWVVELNFFAPDTGLCACWLVRDPGLLWLEDLLFWMGHSLGNGWQFLHWYPELGWVPHLILHNCQWCLQPKNPPLQSVVSTGNIHVHLSFRSKMVLFCPWKVVHMNWTCDQKLAGSSPIWYLAGWMPIKVSNQNTKMDHTCTCASQFVLRCVLKRCDYVQWFSWKWSFFSLYLIPGNVTSVELVVFSSVSEGLCLKSP